MYTNKFWNDPSTVQLIRSLSDINSYKFEKALSLNKKHMSPARVNSLHACEHRCVLNLFLFLNSLIELLDDFNDKVCLNE